MAKQRRGRRVWAAAVVLVGAGAAAALFYLARPVSAGSIRRDPRAFEGRTVSLAGKVVGGASLGGALMSVFGGGKGAFLLDDGTGQIGVTMDGPAPRKGQRVVVRGRVALLATITIPDSWLRAAGVPGNSPAGGEVTAAVVHAEQVWVR
ncbi:MAG: hypothetical protein HY321_20620 [Armatimonadetes bacterium]|nr:hypothetical protein [Armatimonadota bacterium]